MSITITSTMTVEQLAELCAEHSTPKMEVYVRIESIRGKPIAYLMRETVQDYSHIPALLRRQAPDGPV